MTDSEVPDPFTPADCDLTDYRFMPLEVLRLRDSAIVDTVSGDEFKAAVLLWCAAWHQVPAASLPDDDLQLAKLAGFGRVVSEWTKVREGALHGFVKCADGRLYHPVIADRAIDAWKGKRAATRRSSAFSRAGKLGAEKRWRNQEVNGEANGHPNGEANSSKEGKGREWNGIDNKNTPTGSSIEPIDPPDERHPISNGKTNGNGHSTKIERAQEFPNDDDIAEAVEHWNIKAAQFGLAQIEKMTGKRRSHLRARLRELGELGAWFGTINGMSEMPFLLGKVKDWKADFDWVINESNFRKIDEGKYRR